MKKMEFNDILEKMKKLSTIASMPNYWNGKDVKLIRFELDNDQNYYAIVPKNIHLDRLYEVDIFDVRSNIE